MFWDQISIFYYCMILIRQTNQQTTTARLKKIGPFRRSLSFASSPRILSYFLRSVHLNIPHIFQFNHASFGKFRGISEETLMHRRVPRWLSQITWCRVKLLMGNCDINVTRKPTKNIFNQIPGYSCHGYWQLRRAIKIKICPVLPYTLFSLFLSYQKQY